MIAKRLDCPYTPGRRWRLIKVKNHQRQELVVGGWLPARATAAGGSDPSWATTTRRRPRRASTTASSTSSTRARSAPGSPRRRWPTCSALEPAGAQGLAVRGPAAAERREPGGPGMGRGRVQRGTQGATCAKPLFKGLRDDKDANAVVREGRTGRCSEPRARRRMLKAPSVNCAVRRPVLARCTPVARMFRTLRQGFVEAGTSTPSAGESDAFSDPVTALVTRWRS